MYLTHYDTNGNIMGFYIIGIHTNIPEPNLEITEEQHRDYFNNWQNYKIIDGAFTYVEPVEPIAEELQNQALDVLNAEYAIKFETLNRLYNNPSLALEPGDPQIAINQAEIAAEFKATAAELLIKQEAILNG